MELIDFKNRYGIVVGEIETLFPNTIRVMFNKRRIHLLDKESGQLIPTSQIIDGDIEVDEIIKENLLYEIFERNYRTN